MMSVMIGRINKMWRKLALSLLIVILCGFITPGKIIAARAVLAA